MWNKHTCTFSYVSPSLLHKSKQTLPLNSSQNTSSLFADALCRLSTECECVCEGGSLELRLKLRVERLCGPWKDRAAPSPCGPAGCEQGQSLCLSVAAWLETMGDPRAGAPLSQQWGSFNPSAMKRPGPPHCTVVARSAIWQDNSESNKRHCLA